MRAGRRCRKREKGLGNCHRDSTLKSLFGKGGLTGEETRYILMEIGRRNGGTVRGLSQKVKVKVGRLGRKGWRVGSKAAMGNI